MIDPETLPIQLEVTIISAPLDVNALVFMEGQGAKTAEAASNEKTREPIIETSLVNPVVSSPDAE